MFPKQHRLELGYNRAANFHFLNDYRIKIT